MKTLKKLFQNPLFNLALIGLITFLVYKSLLGSNWQQVMDSIKTANIWYLSLAILAQCLSVVLAGIVLWSIGRLFKQKMSKTLAIDASFVSALGSGIMPLGSGAQLFQFYVFDKSNIERSSIVAMLWIEFILFQASLVVTALILILLNLKPLIQSGYWIGVVVGFIITSFVLIGLTLLSLSQTFYNLVIKVVTKIYSILPIKKDSQEFESSLRQQVLKFKDALDLFKSNKKSILILLGLNIIRMILFLSVSIWIGYSFGLLNLDIVGILGGHIFVMMHNSFIPIPGQTGSSEFFFQQFLSPYYQHQTTQILIVWRFIQYYLVLILGALVFLKVKVRRNKT